MESELLMTQDSHGDNRYWRMMVEETPAGVFTKTEYWKEGGSHITSEPTRITGKNIGRSNETTPLQQAISEMESTVRKQKDQGYYPVGGERTLVYDLPMKAQELQKRKKPIPYPVLVQPKIDGLRVRWDASRGFWTSGGKPFIEAVTAHIHFPTDVLAGVVVDGELVLPAPYTFQDTVSAAKRFNIETSPLLRFSVFDYYIPDNPGVIASVRLSRTREMAFPGTVPVPYYLVHSWEELKARHDEFVAAGYEGTIVRLPDGVYEIGKRSHYVLKYKDFVDAEFRIIDIIDGKGKEEGVASLICVTEEGKHFKSSINASLEERRRIFQNREEFLGRLAKVRYQNWTDEGKPRFPKVLSIRDRDLEG